MSQIDSPGELGFQGRSGALREDTNRVAALSAALAARGAALTLSSRIRDHHGILLTGSALITAIADWLRSNGIDPDTGAPMSDGSLPVRPPVIMPGSVPPPGLPISERHRWACHWALTIQAQLTDNLPGMRFKGAPAPDGGPGIVTICSEWLVVCQLANTGYIHSPDGFSWGFGGSGPAALSRSLLTAALGPAAVCPACLGSGKTTWLIDGPDHPVPWQPEHDALDNTEGPDSEATIMTCDECAGDGIGITPTVYNAFKEAVVARLDTDAPWSLHRNAVLNWAEQQNVSVRLAVAAAGVQR
jgi:hypothetical protein